MPKTEIERIASMETEVKNQGEKLNNIENSVQALHGKFDTFQQTITTNYVAKDTFEEWKKNRWLERALVIIVTAAISGLVSYFIKS